MNSLCQSYPASRGPFDLPRKVFERTCARKVCQSKFALSCVTRHVFLPSLKLYSPLNLEHPISGELLNFNRPKKYTATSLKSLKILILVAQTAFGDSRSCKQELTKSIVNEDSLLKAYSTSEWDKCIYYVVLCCVFMIFKRCLISTFQLSSSLF